MSETRQIRALVSVTLVAGVLGLAAVWYAPSLLRDDDAYVASYSATFYPDGTLVEDFTYVLNVGGLRMLYRSWDAPVSFDPLGRAYVEPVEVVGPLGTVPYFMEHDRELTLDTPFDYLWDVYSEIRDLAYPNEVGCYNRERFEPGSYDARYVFRLHPPVEWDDEDAHLNLKFADEHLRYDEVTITFPDAGYVSEVYAHPPSLRVERAGGEIVVTGRSGRDELLEVELLIDPDAMDSLDGFPNQIDDVRGRTVSANRNYSFQYLAAVGAMRLAQALVLLSPFLFYGIYHLYGREGEYTVPRYLSFVPNRDRKPWLVNQIFKSDALDYDDDGFYATLLGWW